MEDSIYEKKGCIKENHRENERVIEDIFWEQKCYETLHGILPFGKRNTCLNKIKI